MENEYVIVIFIYISEINIKQLHNIYLIRWNRCPHCPRNVLTCSMHHNVKSIQNIKAYTSLQLIQISIRVPSILFRFSNTIRSYSAASWSSSAAPCLRRSPSRWRHSCAEHRITTSSIQPSIQPGSWWCCIAAVPHLSIALHIAAYGFISTSMLLANPEPSAAAAWKSTKASSSLPSCGRCVSEESDHQSYSYCA